MMKATKNSNTTIIGLDVGGRRIGVARANTIARLPEPLTTILNDDQIFERLSKLVNEEQVVAVVMGLPRGMSGQETDQTKATRSFYNRLKEYLAVPVYLQDEALTSQKAEEELWTHGRNRDKAMIDALAATYILEDFLRQNTMTKEYKWITK